MNKYIVYLEFEMNGENIEEVEQAANIIVKNSTFRGIQDLDTNLKVTVRGTSQ